MIKMTMTYMVKKMTNLRIMTRGHEKKDEKNDKYDLNMSIKRGLMRYMKTIIGKNYK